MLLLAVPFNLTAQFEEEFKKCFKTKPKLDFKFDTRFSFITNSNVKTTGIKLGLSYDKKFKVGIGINNLLLEVKTEVTDENGRVYPDAELSYGYFSPYIEYVFYTSKRWEFVLAAQLGLGGASYQYLDTLQNKTIKIIESAVVSYEPAMLIDYKIVPWVGLGTGIGYRLVLYSEPGIAENFTSPEYVLKVKVYLGQIWKDITGKNKKKE